MQKSYVSSVISELAKIGIIWPFLATFGTEIVTRWQELFFYYLILLKTVQISVGSWCTICANLVFSHAYFGKTQKLDFLLNS